jgi:hypothetical protein
MRRLTFVIGLLFVANTVAFAQTIGGDCVLRSKTYTWKAQSVYFTTSTFTLATPTVDSDFLITLYASMPRTNNPQLDFIDAWLEYTDEFGDVVQAPFSVGAENPFNPGQASGVVHIPANQTLVLKVWGSVQAPDIYNLVVTKTKLNPCPTDN